MAQKSKQEIVVIHTDFDIPLSKSFFDNVSSPKICNTFAKYIVVEVR